MDTVKNLISSVKKIKHIKLILVAVAVGVFLCIYSPPASSPSGVGDFENTISELCHELCGTTPYVSVESDSFGAPSGVVVLLTKANDNVKLKITEMLVCLYDIPANRIYIGEKFS